MKQYVFRKLCETLNISYKLDKKWKSYSLYNLSILTLPPVVKLYQGDTLSREGRRWGNSVMYCFFLLSCPMIFLRRFRHVIDRGNRSASINWFSITPALMEVGCVLCTPPPSTRLALRSDISKLDCTGQKVNNLRNRWAYIAVYGLILKWKSHAIA